MEGGGFGSRDRFWFDRLALVLGGEDWFRYLFMLIIVRVRVMSFLVLMFFSNLNLSCRV